MSQTAPSPENPHPYRSARILDADMAWIDTGSGDPIVFLHGNPTTSYLWRNVIPHLSGLGRCLAPDLIGFGRSGGMPSRSYRYSDHSRYIGAWMDEVAPEGPVTLVIQDWGAALGFNWANHHRDRVRGICYGEAMVQPRRFDDLPEAVRGTFRRFREPDFFRQCVEQDFFVEKMLPNGVLRGLDPAAHDEYRRRYTSPDGALPSMIWPLEIPFDGEPKDNHDIVQAYADWLSVSQVPKLFVNTTQGHALIGRNREFCRTWPNQQEIALEAKHFYQEDCPDELGRAIATWYRGLV